MKIAIIGQGYVGLTIASFASKFHEVVGFDSNPKVVANLNLGNSHIEGVSSLDLGAVVASGRYRASSTPSDISDAEIVVIAVPTPLDEYRQPDLTYIENACKTIAENIQKPVLIINESTSFPGTIRNLIKPLVEKLSAEKFDHLYAISPERVDPGRIDWDQKNTPRLYAGLTTEASDKTKEFYSSFCDNLVEVSSPEVAEAAKLFENTFRQVNIALVNEFAQIAHALGISVYETLQAADTKPYGFMKFNPSAGVGGHCIPVDPSYLSYVAEQAGVPATFIQLANKVNLDMAKYVVSRVKSDHSDSIQGKRVQVIGVAYKPNVADTRETPATLITEALKLEGALVTWHDPIVGKWNNSESSPLGNSDIAIVITKHESMEDAEILKSSPYVFDTTGKIPGAKSL
jgi:UDP-N-acetyl-D-glucosamine dehydrogenase